LDVRVPIGRAEGVGTALRSDPARSLDHVEDGRDPVLRGEESGVPHEQLYVVSSASTASGREKRRNEYLLGRVWGEDEPPSADVPRRAGAPYAVRRPSADIWRESDPLADRPTAGVAIM
jgi:hypothetical protein